MIYYSAFLMDSLTRRVLLFCRDHKRIWQTAHTSYRPTPKTPQDNENGLHEAFQSAFEVTHDSKNLPRYIEGPHVSLTIVKSNLIRSDFDYGDILPWDIEEANRLNLDPRTRQALNDNIGLLSYFSDVDRDIWCPIQDFAHAASRT